MSEPENYAAAHNDVTMQMEIVFRGAYAYYLQHYLKWFNRDQILILNANLLKTDPAKLLIQTQGKFKGHIDVGDYQYPVTNMTVALSTLNINLT